MRIAVVDVGTNTTRLLIAEVDDRRRVADELVRLSRVTRLGAGVDSSGELAPDALAREFGALDEFGAVIASHEVGRRVAVMTSAVRDARNGRSFADDAAARYGLDVHILSGDDEARLTYLGATDQLHDSRGRTLVIDIGGGSTELVIGLGREVQFHVSTQAGVVRQADRHLTGDPPSAAELEAVARDVRAVLAAAVPIGERAGIARALAVAGTPTSLAAIAQELDPYDPARVHGYRLTAACRDRLRARLAALPLNERRRVVGLHPDRAITILPGIVILAEVMDVFDLDAVEVSEHDILRGAAEAYSS